MSSAHYTPTVTFSGNIVPTVQAAIPFQQTTINRPLAPQAAVFQLGGAYTSTPIPYLGLGGTVGVWDVSTDPWTYFDNRNVTDNLDVVANGGSLIVQQTKTSTLPGSVINIHSNIGTLSFSETQIWSGAYDTFNVLGNAGTLNIDTLVNATYGSSGIYVQGLCVSSMCWPTRERSICKTPCRRTSSITASNRR